MIPGRLLKIYPLNSAEYFFDNLSNKIRNEKEITFMENAWINSGTINIQLFIHSTKYCEMNENMINLLEGIYKNVLPISELYKITIWPK